MNAKEAIERRLKQKLRERALLDHDITELKMLLNSVNVAEQDEINKAGAEING